MKVAIVGAGISGLVCAHLLDEAGHEVTLFEKNAYLGGHAHTVEVQDHGQSFALDTGFLVYNEPGYPGFTKLLKKLQVETIKSDMSFSVSTKSHDFEYNGHSLTSLFAQKRNLVNPKFYGMLRDILRFNQRVKQLIQTDTGLSLKQFIEQEKFGQYFREYYLRPMLAAIWSMDPHAVFDFPLLFLGRFFLNHGLLEISKRPQWRTIKGGSKNYVAAIMKRFKGEVIQNQVQQVLPVTTGYEIHCQNGDKHTAEAVIMASHSDETLAMCPQMPGPQAKALQRIRYQNNDVVLHLDASLMPRRKQAWASWNYQIAPGSQQATLTYYINHLQQVISPRPFFVTLNQRQQIDPALILQEFEYAHPVFDAETLSAQAEIREHNGTDQFYLCGAYLGNGFHEDGVQSALAVCRAFGITSL
jgi:predicted NAD/FAD-binding protein